MKILFIKVKIETNMMGRGIELDIIEPLDFEYIAAGVPDHDIEFFDLRIEKESALPGVISRFQPDVVGFSAFTAEVYAAKKIMKKVKDIKENIKIVVGGFHATFAPQDFNVPYIDAIVIGPGVESFREIIRSFEKGLSLHPIAGLALPGPGGLHLTPQRPLPTSLDDYPRPDRRICTHYQKNYFADLWRPVGTIRTSAGCHFRCNFCAVWRLTGGHYLAHSAERTAEEMLHMKQNYLFFTDDNCFFPLPQEIERMDRVYRILKDAQFKKKLYMCSRSDCIVNYPRIFEKWASIGLTRLFVGLEAGTNRELAGWNKNNQVTVNEKAIAILHELGIEVWGQFIIKPDYTRDDFKRLADYILHHNITYPAFSILTPHPGLDPNDYRQYGEFNKNFEFFDHMHTVFNPTLPLKEFYYEFANLWRVCYSPMCRTGFNRYAKSIYKIFFSSPPHLLRLLRASKLFFQRCQNVWQEHEPFTS
ncbi:MAG TPA: radical SAM protein [Candidatus Deferrimicrobium sp.]|nr:radical SAM protein [Candidatus Deferrimicrobium sp.]